MESNGNGKLLKPYFKLEKKIVKRYYLKLFSILDMLYTYCVT